MRLQCLKKLVGTQNASCDHLILVPNSGIFRLSEGAEGCSSFLSTIDSSMGHLHLRGGFHELLTVQPITVSRPDRSMNPAKPLNLTRGR